MNFSGENRTSQEGTSIEKKFCRNVSEVGHQQRKTRSHKEPFPVTAGKKLYGMVIV
jgi:hypothetical protein